MAAGTNLPAQDWIKKGGLLNGKFGFKALPDGSRTQEQRYLHLLSMWTGVPPNHVQSHIPSSQLMQGDLLPPLQADHAV